VPQLAAVETVDNGSLHEAMALRVLPRGANNIRFFADFAVERLAEPERTLHGGERNRVRYDPAGVTAVSTPWNAPFMLATWRVGPRSPRQHGRPEAAGVGAADLLHARRPGRRGRACRPAC
jgi:5-carboxymethyl-2-hydroxymuconic-semialdehyde dehydrogenase